MSRLREPEPRTLQEMQARARAAQDRMFAAGRAFEARRSAPPAVVPSPIAEAPPPPSTRTAVTISEREAELLTQEAGRRGLSVEQLVRGVLHTFLVEADLVGADDQGDKRPLLVDDVIAHVAGAHGMRSADLRSDRKDAPTVLARHRAMWLAKRLTPRSLPVIGRRFGRDHTTVLAAIRNVDAACRADPITAAVLASMEGAIRVRFAPASPSVDPADAR